MSNSRRQELYNQIRQTSKEEFILSEMLRLGFWTEGEGNTSEPAELIKKSGELRREMSNLMAKKKAFKNKEKMLREMRKKRMKEAKAKRQETKDKNERLRKEKAEKWAEKQKKEIVYLGEGVSKGLAQTESQKDTLVNHNLPYFENALALAEAMNIDLAKLRFFAYNRKISKVNHYKRFEVPKKSGGKRLISAPMPRLKALQYWILENILYKVRLHEKAHGFVPEKSILSNAEPHIGKEVVINLDMKDFFPSIALHRVKGLFKSLGYSEQIATILGLLCTEPEVDEVILDGDKYYAQKGERKLPQGAPTSPAITNLICYKLDRRFEGLAKKWNWNYTRYADDLTFSASGDAAQSVNRILWAARQVIENEGFVLHPDKIRVMRKGSKQEVTGIVVNDKKGVDRKTLRKFRALLHQIEQNGIEGKTWGNGHILNTIQGYANFVAQVKPEQGAKLKKQVQTIINNLTTTAAIQKEMVATIPQPNTEKPIEKTNENKSVETDLPWWRLW